MTSVFVSYARENQEAVKSLALDLGELDYQVWFDNELTGGQTWWDQLLAKIRECDSFAFGLSPESLDSQACKLERTYALNLGKSILPILIADDVPTDLLPTDLAQVHFVDYRAADKRALISLLKAIKRLPLPRPLPSPRPEPPAAPVSYLGSLRERVESAGQLSSQEQAELLLTLKRGLKDAKGKAGALTLLKQMRNRQDLYAWIGEEIDELVASAAVSLATDGSLLVLEKTDWSKALDQHRQAAAQGDRDAQHVLGMMHHEGLGVATNYEEAAKWNRMAAEGGHKEAQYHLGVMYAFGRGAPKDKLEAVKWFRKAAEQGHSSAQFNLGFRYAKGDGVQRDENEAVKWFRKAAEQGHAKAQAELQKRGMEWPPA